jgi:hypothetical protein
VIADGGAFAVMTGEMADRGDDRGVMADRGVFADRGVIADRGSSVFFFLTAERPR